MSSTFFTATPEQSLRARTMAVWEAGDFGVVAPYTQDVADEFVGRLPVTAGGTFLDLACGTGNLARPAARAGARVTGVDLAARLVEQARLRAAALRLDIEFVAADAEALPFPEATFDCVASMFGLMFVARPEEAAAELIRVCRPGGTIALASWTPEGFIGGSSRIVARHVPPPPSAVWPLQWGEEAIVRDRLGPGVRDLRLARRTARLRYPFSPARTVDFLRQFYGPIVRAFAALEPAGRRVLHVELEDHFHRHNLATDGTTDVAAEYLEVIAVRGPRSTP